MNLVCFTSPSKKMCPITYRWKKHIHFIWGQNNVLMLPLSSTALFLRKSLETTATVKHIEQTSWIHTLLKQIQPSFPFQSLLQSYMPQWRLLNQIREGRGRVKEQRCGDTDLSNQKPTLLCRFMGFTHCVCPRWASALFSHVFNKLFFPLKEPPQRCGFIWNDI